MPMVEWVAVLQTSGPKIETSNLPAARYLVLALIAVVLGLVVWVFIRTSFRGSSKQ